jgi:hypothetical protein
MLKEPGRRSGNEINFWQQIVFFLCWVAGSLAWIGEKVSLLGNCVSCFQRMRTEAFEKSGEDHTFCGAVEDYFHISQFFIQKTQNLSGFYNLGLMVSIVIKIQCSLRGSARNIVGLLHIQFSRSGLNFTELIIFSGISFWLQVGNLLLLKCILFATNSTKIAGIANHLM